MRIFSQAIPPITSTRRPPARRLNQRPTSASDGRARSRRAFETPLGLGPHPAAGAAGLLFRSLEGLLLGLGIMELQPGAGQAGPQQLLVEHPPVDPDIRQE